VSVEDLAGQPVAPGAADLPASVVGGARPRIRALVATARSIYQEWDGFKAVPDQVIGDGDQAAALGWYTGTYRATGAGLRARFVHWFTVRAGLITRFEQVVDSALVERCVSDTPADAGPPR